MGALEDFRAESGTVIGALVADTGWWVAWHDWSPVLRLHGQSVIDRRYAQHHTAFCEAVKARGGRAGCRRCDLIEARAAGADDPAVRVRRCHAGADEVHVPVHHRGEFVGLAYLGQFRRDADQPAVLPWLDPDAVERALAHGRLLQGWLHDLCHRVDAARLAGGDRAARIRALLERDPRADLPQVAHELALSVTRAGHAVREATGRSFTALRDELRLERARQRLLVTDEAIATVGAACGIDDPNYFTRWFRRQTGTTPLAWRRRERGRMEA